MEPERQPEQRSCGQINTMSTMARQQNGIIRQDIVSGHGLAEMTTKLVFASRLAWAQANTDADWDVPVAWLPRACNVGPFLRIPKPDALGTELSTVLLAL
jgi:hypothetical protein